MRTPAQEAVAEALDMAVLALIEGGDPESCAEAALHAGFLYVQECAGTMIPEDFAYELEQLVKETGPHG